MAMPFMALFYSAVSSWPKANTRYCAAVKSWHYLKATKHFIKKVNSVFNKYKKEEKEKTMIKNESQASVITNAESQKGEIEKKKVDNDDNIKNAPKTSNTINDDELDNELNFKPIKS